MSRRLDVSGVRRYALVALAGAVVVLSAARTAQAERGRAPDDPLDALVLRHMALRQVPGLSLAIVDSGRIVDVRAYGWTIRDGGTRVTPSTLFQAASISKPITALGALRLVDHGVLFLDEDVNRRLTTWRVPQSEFTRAEPVTLRRLLSHTAGINIGGIPGYPADEPPPALLAAMTGAGNTPAIDVTLLPGSRFRYAGGGYAITQLLIEDVSSRSFAEYMRDQVLLPLGMTSSTYAVPLPAGWEQHVAVGHTHARGVVAGQWHNFVEAAAAGLWTTPSDLARYIIALSHAVAGESPVISAETARRMLTREQANYGLGPAVEGSGATLRFYHGGRNHGYDSFITGYPALGSGAVVMINANDDGNLVRAVMSEIVRMRGWENYPVWVPEPVHPAAVTVEALRSVAGHYEFGNNALLTLDVVDGQLHSIVRDLPSETFVPATGSRFVSMDRAVALRPHRAANGEVTALEVIEGVEARRIPRVSPLFTSSRRDPDPRVTTRVGEALAQLAAGGEAVGTSSVLTTGARSAFTQPVGALAGIRGLDFVGSHDVRDATLTRHGTSVASVRQYRGRRSDGEMLILVYLDVDGLVADFDVVTR